MGVGAGYKLTVKDIPLDFSDLSKVKVDYGPYGDSPYVCITVPVKADRCIFSAEHPYWGFGNRSPVDALVEGGTITVQLDRDDFRYDKDGSYDRDGEFSEEKMLECVSNELGSVSISDFFSGGWVWSRPDGNWGFEASRYRGSIDEGENTYSVVSADIVSREMAHKVQYAYNRLNRSNVDWDVVLEELEDDLSFLNSRGSLDDFVRENGLEKNKVALLGDVFVFDAKTDDGKWKAIRLLHEEPWYAVSELDDREVRSLYFSHLKEYGASGAGEYGRTVKDNLLDFLDSLDGISLEFCHDEDFVRNAVCSEPMQALEAELFGALSDDLKRYGNNDLDSCLSSFPMFTLPESVEGPVESYVRGYPPLCVRKDGKVFNGFAQVTALAACARHGLPESIRTVVLARPEDKEPDVKIFSFSDRNGSSELKSYGFNMFNDSPGASQILVFRNFMADCGRLKDKYPVLDLPSPEVSVTDDSATLKDYMAGYLAAAEMGVAFKTTRELERRFEGEFKKLLKDAFVEGKHQEFFSLFDRELIGKKRAIVWDTRKGVSNALKVLRNFPELEEVPVEELDEGISR